MPDIQVGDLVKPNTQRQTRSSFLPPGVWIVLKISEAERKLYGASARAVIMKGSKQRFIYISRLEKV